MKQTSELVVCFQSKKTENMAIALAKRLNVSITDKPGEQLSLVVDEQCISLQGYGLSYYGDFEQMLHRITQGRLQHEMLVRVAKSKEEGKKAIDMTAGMGEDSLLLAAAGYEVTMYEQNPVVATLLKDALRRAKKHPVLCDIVGRMQLVEGNSIELLKGCLQQPDLIYLDPMFPARQKSGLIGKKLQLIQKLEQPCFQEEELLLAAQSLHPQKIIVKRPLKGTFLAGREPNYSIKGKAIRYDVFYTSGIIDK